VRLLSVHHEPPSTPCSPSRGRPRVRQCGYAGRSLVSLTLHLRDGRLYFDHTASIRFSGTARQRNASGPLSGATHGALRLLSRRQPSRVELPSTSVGGGLVHRLTDEREPDGAFCSCCRARQVTLAEEDSPAEVSAGPDPGAPREASCGHGAQRRRAAGRSRTPEASRWRRRADRSTDISASNSSAAASVSSELLVVPPRTAVSQLAAWATNLHRCRRLS